MNSVFQYIKKLIEYWKQNACLSFIEKNKNSKKLLVWPGHGMRLIIEYDIIDLLETKNEIW